MDKGELQYQNQSASSPASATFKRMAVWRETKGEDTIEKAEQGGEEEGLERDRDVFFMPIVDHNEWASSTY